MDLPQTIQCGICSSKAPLDKNDMAYKCELCGTEVWTDEHRLKEYQRILRQRETAEQDRQRSLSRVGWDNRTEILSIYPVPSGSGGSKSGRRGKILKKKLKIEKWQG